MIRIDSLKNVGPQISKSALILRELLIRPFLLDQWFSTFLGGDTHFKNEKRETNLECPNYA